MNLLRERRHQSGDPDRAQVEHHARGVAAADAHGDRLVGDRRRRRAAGSEPAPPGLHRVGALGPVGRVAGALLERLHQAEQPAFLLVPALDRVPEPALAILPRLRVGGVRAAVHPRAVALERHDRPDRAGEHLTVVGDHHDRLLGRLHPALERQLGRHVEEVVGLVEQQHLGVGGEQHVEHELLALTARQRPRRPIGDLGKRGVDDAPARRVPLALELVAAERRPVGDRLAELHPRRRIPGLELGLEREHALAGLAHGPWRHRQQQRADRLVAVAHADVLRHVAEPPADRVLALVGRQLARRGSSAACSCRPRSSRRAPRAVPVRPGTTPPRTGGHRPDGRTPDSRPPHAPSPHVRTAPVGATVSGSVPRPRACGPGSRR